MVQVKGQSFIDKYRARPKRYARMNLLTFARRVTVRGQQYSEPKKESIVRVLPIIKFVPGCDNEAYYRQQAILHIPFKGVPESILNRQKYQSWTKLCNDMAIAQMPSSELPEYNSSDDEYENAVPVDHGIHQNAGEALADHQQLPPVCDTPLYRFDSKDPKIQLGISLLRAFQKYIELTTAHRQSTDGQYAELLVRLAHGQITDDDYSLLRTRNQALLSPEEISSFNTAIHLCAKKDIVAQKNAAHLEQLAQPVAAIQSRSCPDIIMHQSSDRGQGLEPILLLSIGARVMLRKNLWIRGGLVNGATGTVRAIIYSANAQPHELPMCVMVEFDNYHGHTIRD